METKRIVCLIAVYLAVLSGFALYARFDKQNEPKYAVQSNVFATGNNRSAASASAMQDDPEFGRFDCVLAQNDNDFLICI